MNSPQILQSMTAMRLILLFFLLQTIALSGCGKGNAKTHLTLDEVKQLQNASKIYLVHYQSPDFFLSVKRPPPAGPFIGGILSIVAGADFDGSKISVRKNWDEIKEEMDLEFSPHDITEKMKTGIVNTLKNQYGFTNIESGNSFEKNSSLMPLKEKLGNANVIDITTKFWHLAPTGKGLSQFQYYGEIRVIDLQAISVVLQHQCHYPAQSRNTGQSLRPQMESVWSRPVWINSMSLTDLVANNGAKIQSQINKAVSHCLKEFTDEFFHEVNGQSNSLAN